MAKIKIHKNNISFFDGDVVAGYIKYRSGYEEKWIFVYREQDNPERIGCHCCYCDNYNDSHKYFSIDATYDDIKKEYIRNNNNHFFKCDMCDLRFATDEERDELASILINRCSKDRAYNKLMKFYLDMIYGQD